MLKGVPILLCLRRCQARKGKQASKVIYIIPPKVGIHSNTKFKNTWRNSYLQKLYHSFYLEQIFEKL